MNDYSWDQRNDNSAIHIFINNRSESIDTQRAQDLLEPFLIPSAKSDPGSSRPQGWSSRGFTKNIEAYGRLAENAPSWSAVWKNIKLIQNLWCRFPFFGKPCRVWELGKASWGMYLQFYNNYWLGDLDLLKRGRNLRKNDGMRFLCWGSCSSRGSCCLKPEICLLGGLGVDEIGSLLLKFWTAQLEKFWCRSWGDGVNMLLWLVWSEILGKLLVLIGW